MVSEENGAWKRPGWLLAPAVLAMIAVAAGYGVNLSPARTGGAGAAAVTAGAGLKTHAPSGIKAPRTLREAYPDYRPEERDPEHDAVVRGRREVPRDAALALDPGGSPSIRSLIEQAIDGTEVGDAAVFSRLCITRHDFETVLWPEFPQSRPAAGVPALEAWDFLHLRNAGGFNNARGLCQGRGIRLTGFRPGAVREYTNFRLHEGVEVDVRDETGAEFDFPLIRTIVECNGRFKIYAAGD